MANAVILKNRRPKLVIEYMGGKNLGRCYNSVLYKITSTSPLSMKNFEVLREAGVMDVGQNMDVHVLSEDGSRKPAPPRLDGSTKVVPTGFDVVNHVEIDALGNVINENPINPISLTPYHPGRFPYYEYECEFTIDSSD